MRGVILAGGTGSRLGLLTKTLNKHVLPVASKPMICWPLATLTDNQITDITVVSTPSGVGQIANLLGSGSDFGCDLTYRVQDQPGGVAQALMCAYRKDLNGEPLAVILGDNVFGKTPLILSDTVTKCYLKRIPDKEKLRSLGVVLAYDKNGSIIGVVEKPVDPPSEFAVTGLYVFGYGVFDVLRTQKASGRGELEITDLLNFYAETETLSCYVTSGFWGDAGTLDGLAECSLAMKGEA